MHYSIIIPIHNEENSITRLLSELKIYSKKNQILIINDGSTDSSKLLLSKCNFITLINLEKNFGKGYSITYGLKKAKYDKVLISDGDLELKTNELKNLMILDKTKDINCVFGSRFENNIDIISIWDIGNLFFKIIFNLVYKTKLNDVLCCSKAFYKNDIKLKKIKSQGFNIDIELNSVLVQKFNNITTIPLSYKRRNSNEGKKINLFDGFKIFLQIFLSKK